MGPQGPPCFLSETLYWPRSFVAAGILPPQYPLVLRGLGLIATSANDVCAVLKTDLRNDAGILYKAYFDMLQEKGLGVGAVAHGPDPTIPAATCDCPSVS